MNNLLKYFSMISSTLSINDSIANELKGLKTGRMRKKTKREIALSKAHSIARHELRRTHLLAHQRNSFVRRKEALSRLSPKVKVIGGAKKRAIKRGKLGKKGGLITA